MDFMHDFDQSYLDELKCKIFKQSDSNFHVVFIDKDLN